MKKTMRGKTTIESNVHMRWLYLNRGVLKEEKNERFIFGLDF